MSERVVIKNARLSYPHLFRPESFDGQDPKYGCVLIIPKNDPQAQTLKDLIVKVGAADFPDKVKAGGKWPATLHFPVKNGDDRAEENPEYAGCYYISVSSKNPVVLLDRAKRKLTEEDDKLYPGCYVNASLTVASFNVTAKKGVSIFLNGVQFNADGERLAGHDAAADFEQLDEDDFDDIL